MSSNTGFEELYQCQICCKTFSRRTYLVLHEKIHGEKSYKCNICDKAFSQPAGLWIHKKHQSCLKRNSLGESRAISENEKNVGKRHECDICNRRFSQKHLLSYHMRTHTGENPYPCTICGKTFRGAVTLKYHERTHTGQRPYTCIFCEKSFTQLGPLRAHCRKEHQSDRIYECDVCMEKFEKFRELSSHKKTHLEACSDSPCEDVGISDTECMNALIHVSNDSSQNLDKSKKMDNESVLETAVDSVLDNSTVETPTSSKKDASEPSSLINSKKRKRKAQSKSLDPRRNIRLKKSVVEVVGRNYTEGKNSCVLITHKHSAMVSEELKTINYEDWSFPQGHVPAIHQNEEDSLNQRTHCGEEFLEANVLQNDSKTRTEKNPFHCTECNKTFRTPGALTVHQRTHNGKRPYKCIFCPQDFTQRGALLQHCRRIHNTDLIYECDVCNEKFEKHRDLLSHSLAHSDVPCTMAKRTRLYDGVDFAVKFGNDEGKPGDDTVDSPLSLSNVNGEKFESIPKNNPMPAEGSCIVTNDDNKKYRANPSSFIREEDESSWQDGHQNRFTNPFNCVCDKLENIDVPPAHECVCSVNIKTEKDDYDNYDSGISPDTSPLDFNVKCDESTQNLMYEVSMQPVKPGCEENNYLQMTGFEPSEATNSIGIPTQQNRDIQASVVNDCFRTVVDDDGSDGNVSSDCSRVTTPDNVSLFAENSGNHQQNSFLFDETSDMSFQLRDKSNILTAQPLDPRRQNLTEDDIRNSYFWQTNDYLSGVGCYRGRHLQNNSTEIGSTSELPGCLNLRAFHSNGSLWQ